MAFHKNEVGQSNHVIHSYTYANAAARAIATGLAASDVGKIAKQTDTNQYFILTSVSPTYWVEISGRLPTKSDSCGSFSTSSTSYVDVTNLSISFTTTGRPIKIYLINDASGPGALSGSSSAGANNTLTVTVQALRDSTSCGEHIVSNQINGLTSANSIAVGVPVSSVVFYDEPSAGTYTYKIQIKVGFAGSGSASITNAKLVVEEY